MEEGCGRRRWKDGWKEVYPGGKERRWGRCASGAAGQKPKARAFHRRRRSQRPICRPPTQPISPFLPSLHCLNFPSLPPALYDGTIVVRASLLTLPACLTPLFSSLPSPPPRGSQNQKLLPFIGPWALEGFCQFSVHYLFLNKTAQFARADITAFGPATFFFAFLFVSCACPRTDGRPFCVEFVRMSSSLPILFLLLFTSPQPTGIILAFAQPILWSMALLNFVG
jgi:hypothetical protein